MRYAVRVEELPYITICPIDDWRHKYLVLATYAGDHLFFVFAPLVEGYLIALAFYIYADFFPLGASCAFFFAYTEKRHFARAAGFFKYGTAPA